MSNYRNRKLLDLAHRIQECQIQIPGICIGFQEHGCEPVHGDSQMFGKGMGIKSHDVAAAGCHACHQRLPKMAREERERAFLMGAWRTMLEYFKRGWIMVK